jgi:hypothetical protein
MNLTSAVLTDRSCPSEFSAKAYSLLMCAVFSMFLLSIPPLKGPLFISFETQIFLAAQSMPLLCLLFHTIEF